MQAFLICLWVSLNNYMLHIHTKITSVRFSQKLILLQPQQLLLLTLEHVELPLQPVPHSMWINLV